MCKRMSGEMNTSVSNGIINLLITHFLLEEKGNKNFDSFFEGDDSINSYDVAPPSSQDYADLGANIKIELPDNLSEASFCGQVFDPVDLDNVANPMEALVSFGWTTNQYTTATKTTRLALLKCKSLSMLYEYSGCPILRELALFGLRITNHIPIEKAKQVFSKSHTDSYHREQWLEMLDNYKDTNIFNNHVKNNTRCLVSKIYSIPIDVQLNVESYLKTKTELTPIVLPELLNLCHKDWIHYYNTYGSGFQPFRQSKDIPMVTVSTGYKCKWFMNKSWFCLT